MADVVNDLSNVPAAGSGAAPEDATLNEARLSPEEMAARRQQRVLLLRIAMGFFAISILSLLATVAAVAAPILLAKSETSPNLQTIIWVALLSGAFGFVLVRAARNAGEPGLGNALPDDARSLFRSIIEQSSDPIGDWTRLVGLTGGTGVFRKLELSGMPLATILMTILFCFMGVFAPALPRILGFTDLQKTGAADAFGNASTIFLDMAKLTLGAFIGSFVTKAKTSDADATKAGVAAAVKAVADGKIQAGGKTRPAASSPNAPGPAEARPSS